MDQEDVSFAVFGVCSFLYMLSVVRTIWLPSLYMYKVQSLLLSSLIRGHFPPSPLLWCPQKVDMRLNINDVISGILCVESI